MRPDQASRSRRLKKASESMSCASSMAMSMGAQCGMPICEAAAEIGACLPAKRSTSTLAGASTSGGLSTHSSRAAWAVSRLQTRLRKVGGLFIAPCVCGLGATSRG